MKNTCLMVHCISSFEVTSNKKNVIWSSSASSFISCSFISHQLRFTQATKPLKSQNMLSLTKVFCWGSVNLENFWFYIWVTVIWLFDFMTQIYNLTSPLTHDHNKKLAKTTKYIVKYWERSLKRIPNLSFISVIKIYLLINVFYRYIVR